MVAQPLFDVIRRNSEFLVAHRAGAREVLGFVVVLLVVVPALPIALAWIAGLFGRVFRQGVVTLALYVLFALLGLQWLKLAGPWSPVAIVVLAGIVAGALAFVYWRSAAARSLASLLVVAVLLAPAVFLFDGSVVKFWRPSRSAWPSPAPATLSTPIVMVVFDQFPLVSLLDADGRIDGRLFPAFAKLAGESTWYRNATAVSDRTGHALPAIVTGVLPRIGTLPKVDDHTNNLFTWLGPVYRLEVLEPLTALCPPGLCTESSEPFRARLESMTSDASVVFLHLITPQAWTGRLPPLTHSWRDFARPTWRKQWAERRRQDRRAAFLQFVRGIEPASSPPAFYFAHVLLPHEPYIYYPSGRTFAAPNEAVPGLKPNERWTTDPWPVAVIHQRFLQQLQMVDRLVGTLVEQLKAVGIYDEALLVIVADHGACFRPGDNYRTPTPRNYADIMSVPLLVKAPHQREGRVDDRNVETIDVAPTMAELLGAPLPWKTDGTSASVEPRRPDKRLTYHAARTHQIRTMSEVVGARNLALQEKLELFGSPVDPDRPVGLEPAARLLGLPVDSVPRRQADGFQVRFDEASLYTSAATGATFVPGLVTGRAEVRSSSVAPPELAVAVNGVIRGVARLYAESSDAVPVWSALIPEGAFEHGVKRVEAFEVLDEHGQLALRETGAVSEPGEAVNLLSDAIQARLQIKATGLHDQEFLGTRMFRWTAASARFEAPIDRASPPRSLTIGIAQDGPPRRRLRIHANRCELYSGPVPPSPWRQTFSIEDCVGRGSKVVIDVRSDPFVPGREDRRELGVALDVVALAR